MRRLLLLFAVASCGRDTQLPDAVAADTFDRGPNELPCEVKAALEAACTTCHSSPPCANAPQSLVERFDFFKPAITVPGRTVAQQALASLTPGDAQAMPPPSEPPAAASDVATLMTWLSAGAPPGTCGAIAPRPLPTTCASNDFWTQGETGAEQMLPGKPCRACHQIEAPEVAYFFAGTVFPAFHEQDLCNSPPPTGARIEIVDVITGAVSLTLTPDTAGNFTSLETSPGVVPIPYRARLVANGRA